MHGCMLDHVRSAHDMVSFVDCLGQFQLGTCIMIIRCWPHGLVQDVERQPLVLLNVVCKFLRFFFAVSDRSPGAFRDRASSTGPLAWQSVSVFPPLALLHFEAAFFFYCCFLCSIFFFFFCMWTLILMSIKFTQCHLCFSNWLLFPRCCSLFTLSASGVSFRHCLFLTALWASQSEWIEWVLDSNRRAFCVALRLFFFMFPFPNPFLHRLFRQ